jgi:hypothetical protein
MSATINGVVVALGATGTYYGTDGNSYTGEVVKVVESDCTKLLVVANSGVEPMPDNYCVVRVNDLLHTNPLVKAHGARTTQVDCFELAE